MYTDRIDGIIAGIDTSTVAKALESYAGIHTSEKIGTDDLSNDVNAGFYNPSELFSRYDYS